MPKCRPYNLNLRAAAPFARITGRPCLVVIFVSFSLLLWESKQRRENKESNFDIVYANEAEPFKSQESKVKSLLWFYSEQRAVEWRRKETFMMELLLLTRALHHLCPVELRQR